MVQAHSPKVDEVRGQLFCKPFTKVKLKLSHKDLKGAHRSPNKSPHFSIYIQASLHLHITTQAILMLLLGICIISFYLYQGIVSHQKQLLRTDTGKCGRGILSALITVTTSPTPTFLHAAKKTGKYKFIE